MVYMKIELKANQQGQIYLPKLLRDQWGNEYVLVPNAQGGYIYPKGVRAKDALRSLEIVRQDMEHRAELEERKTNVVRGIGHEQASSRLR